MAKHVRSLVVAIASLLVVACVALGSHPARVSAAVITVNSFDQVDEALCTLSDAIRSANADRDIGGCTHTGDYGADTIVLPAGLFALTAPATEMGATALPVVTGEITILGNGAVIARTNGESEPFFRLFEVTLGTLTLVELTVTGGLIREPGGDVAGGGILGHAEGSLALRSMTIAGNAVDADAGSDGIGGTARGGALYFEGTGTLNLTNVAVIGNSVTSRGGIADGESTPLVAGSGRAGVVRGGGIAFAGATELLFTGGAVSNNTAIADAGESDVAGRAEGGGIHVAGVPGLPRLVLSGVSVTSNTARAVGGEAGQGGVAHGGGLFYDQDAAVGAGLIVSESTFGGNSAVADGGSGTSGGKARGGGIYCIARASIPPVFVTSSAFVQNTVHADGGLTPSRDSKGGRAEGGGLYFRTVGVDGTLVLDGVTLTSNAATAAFGAGGNSGTAAGGAVWFDAEGGSVDLRNTTMTGNTLAALAGTLSGAGIQAASAATLMSSIVSDNSASGIVGSVDCAGGPFTSLGHNIMPSAGCGAPTDTDKPDVPPDLGPLVNIGRPGGQFLPPLPGSPAIDSGDRFSCTSSDQIGQGRAGVCDIGAVEVVAATGLAASILPSTRSGLVGAKLTAFVSVVNAGATPAYKVRPELSSNVPALFSYHATDPLTNALRGLPNTPMDIGPSRTQTYVITVTPSAPLPPTDLILSFRGTNTLPVAPIIGLNTLLLSASLTPIPDLVALAATIGNNGIVDIPGPTGTGIFSMATVNLGAPGAITVAADTGPAVLPVIISLCETNPASGACISPIRESVTTLIDSGATPTFAFFVTAFGTVPFDPAVNRVFVRLKDASNVTRGGTSVAPRTP